METIGLVERHGKMVSVKTKSALISDIDTAVQTVRDRFDGDTDGDAERDFIVQRCPAHLESVIRELPTLSMHLMARIEDGPVSVVGLAARSAQLKGTVSKHVQRLVAAGLVQRAPIPGNRKEIALTLTDDGASVARAHLELHQEMTQSLHDFLQRYSQADLQVLATVLADLASAEKIGVRIRPPG